MAWVLKDALVLHGLGHLSQAALLGRPNGIGVEGGPALEEELKELVGAANVEAHVEEVLREGAAPRMEDTKRLYHVGGD